MSIQTPFVQGGMISNNHSPTSQQRGHSFAYTKAFEKSVSRRWKRWRLVIFWTLFFAYVANYFCRASMPVSSTLFFDQPSPIQNDQTYGVLLTVGTFVYGVGKVSSGFFVVWLGAKTVFVFGCLGSAVFSMAFGFGNSYAWLVTSWTLGRFCQATLFASIVQIVSNWWEKTDHGYIIATISISYLLGDALARLVLATLIEVGWTWHGLFFFSAAIMMALTIVCIFVVKESPAKVHLPLLPHMTFRSESEEVMSHFSFSSIPHLIHDNIPPSPGTTSQSNPPKQSQTTQLTHKTQYLNAPASSSVSIGDDTTINKDYDGWETDELSDSAKHQYVAPNAFLEVVSMQSFWIVALMQVCLLFVRETFRDWLPILFHDVAGVDDAEAALWSFVYPVGGVISTLTIGIVSDRLEGQRRGPIVTAFGLVALTSLALLWNETRQLDVDDPEKHPSFWYCVLLAAFLGLGIYGPYSATATFSIDCVTDRPGRNKDSVAMFTGLTQGIGYLSGAFSGVLVGTLVEDEGWSTATMMMLGITTGFVLTCIWYSFIEHKRIQREVFVNTGKVS